MITLLKNADVYAPEHLGKKDVLIADSRIAVVADPGEVTMSGLKVESVDASGKMAIPGIIDSHVHILGGGGEGGPSTRAPEITVEDIISSGVTTVIGCLGTDGTTRHMESLLAKANGLEVEGVNTYIFSGSYELPVKTLTGCVRSDLILIHKVIGAGEIAVSDHRSAQPSFADFAKLAAECRVGGMLGGKAGILHCHLGSGPRRLEMLHRLVDETEIPVTQIIPTHINRNRELLEDSVGFLDKGGYVDLTADLDPAQDKELISIASCVMFYKEKKAPLDRITVSSDGNGSIPSFDDKGILIGLTVASQKSLLANFQYVVKNKVLEIEETIKLFATTPADFYGLERKGRIKMGMDADIILLDEDLALTDSFIRGKRLMAEKKILVRGTFSKE